MISEIVTESNTSGCHGREAELIEEENVRHFALTLNFRALFWMISSLSE